MCPTETPLGGPAELARQGRARVSGTIFPTVVIDLEFIKFRFLKFIEFETSEKDAESQ